MNRRWGGRKQMSNELTTQVQQSSLLQIRMDSKTYPRLLRYDHAEAVKRMTKIVSQAMLYRGQTADPASIGIISSALLDELLIEDRWGARFLTFEEIAYVVKKAVLESDLYISVSSLYKVIIEFCKGEGTLIQQEASEIKKKQDRDSLRNSIVAPMLEAYSGQLLKNNKSNGKV